MTIQICYNVYMKTKNGTNPIKSYPRIQTPSELQLFMMDNIKYGFVDRDGNKYFEDNKDYNKNWSEKYRLQSADELLKTFCGTCWDQVELERKWFAEHKYEFKTIFLGFKISKPNNYPTHTFLAYFENSKWHWFENSFNDFCGIHEYISLDVLINDVISNYLHITINSGIAKPEDRKLIKYYGFQKPLLGLDIIKYLGHVTGGVKKIN